MLRSRTSRWLCLLGLFSVYTCAALAQVKVAIINSSTALIETAEMKKAQADLEAKFKPREEQRAKLQQELSTIQQQLQTMGDKLKPEAQAELNVQGQRKQRDLQRLTEDLTAEVDRERTDVVTKSGTRMQQVVTKLAEEKGLDVVIDVSNAVYFKPALDITKEATAAYDKAYPLTK
jgi:outer membrane protein